MVMVGGSVYMKIQIVVSWKVSKEQGNKEAGNQGPTDLSKNFRVVVRNM
jgi:hypothetical protein